MSYLEKDIIYTGASAALSGILLYIINIIIKVTQLNKFIHNSVME